MKYKILVLEDDEDSVFLLKHLDCFSRNDFIISKVVSNGKEALIEIERENYDLILTDINMPFINGLEFAKILRGLSKDIHIIFMSAYEDFSYAKKAIKVGALDYLVKPVREKELEKLLVQVGKELDDRNNMNLPLGMDKSSLQSKVSDKEIEEIYRVMMDVNMTLEEDDKSLNHINMKMKRNTGMDDINNSEVYDKIYSIIDQDENGYDCMKQVLTRIWDTMIYNFSWLSEITNFNLYNDDSRNGKDINETYTRYTYIIYNTIKIFHLSQVDPTMSEICTSMVNNIESKNVFDLVAEEVELSKDYIGRMFKRKMDVTFNEYLTLFKIEYAKKLIIGSKLRVYEISERLGYESTDYFTKLFKNSTGLTPIKFRQEWIKNGFVG